MNEWVSNECNGHIGGCDDEIHVSVIVAASKGS